MRKKRIYVVEGETEVTLFKDLSQNNIIKPGKTFKFNLQNNVLSRKHRVINEHFDQIICVLDTDLNSRDNISRLEDNIKKIKKFNKNILIILQNKNLEDELKKGLNVKNLNQVFKVRNEKGVKKWILTCNNLTSKLLKEDIDFYKMWKGDYQFVKNLNLSIKKLVKDCKLILI